MMATVAFIMVCGPMLTVNVDARSLKFGMKHPWTQSLRFRENQISCMSVSLLVGLLPY